MIITFNKNGQNLSEYTLLLALIMAGILIGGPFAVNSWNGQVESWEDSVIDSFTDPLPEADPRETACVCDENWSIPSIPGDCGIGGCHWSEARRVRTCTPLGCGTESECVPDDGCCSQPSLLPGCGVNADPACPGGCPDGEQCGSIQCGSDPTLQYGCYPGECGRCIGGPYIPDPIEREFIGLCPGDDLGLTENVDYTFVVEGGCTSGTKCEVECREPFSPQEHSGGACACPAGLVYSPETDTCECPPWTTEDEEGNCIFPCSRMANDGNHGVAVVLADGSIRRWNRAGTATVISDQQYTCVGQAGVSCRVTHDGNAICDFLPSTQLNYTGGDAIAVGRQYAPGFICYLTSSGNIHCTNGLEYLGGDAIRMSVSDFTGGLCWVTLGGNAVCTGGYSAGRSMNTGDVVDACGAFRWKAFLKENGEMIIDGRVMFVGDSPGVDIDCGFYKACALFESGLVHCVGGRHNPADRVYPGALEVSVGWTSATTQTDNVCVLLEDGRVECYGYAANPSWCCAW